MRKFSFSPGADLGRGLAGLVLGVAIVALAPAGRGATIVDRRIDVAIAGDTVRTTERLVARMDEMGDLDEWRGYPIYLDSHIELVRWTAKVMDGSGKVVGRARATQRIESPGYDLHNSAWIELIVLPPLAVGQAVVVETETVERPFYPSTEILLGRRSPQERLTVTVTASGAALRHRLRDPGGRLEVEVGEGRLTLTGVDVAPTRDEPLAPGAAVSGATLGLAWGRSATWKDVGRWYDDLTRSARATSPAVNARARELTAGIDSARDRLEALVRHVKRSVRYEAVEVGVGGWVPTPPEQVLERGWGDCKDKSALLSALLMGIGIPSHLVLTNGGAESRVDPRFPSPDRFNHCILGVVATDAGALPDDPVVDGVLLVDATAVAGGAGWLPPFCQGDSALIVDGESSRLVTVADRPARELRSLEIEGALDVSGTLSGTARVRMEGRSALGLLEIMATRPETELEQNLRTLVEQVMPGARVTEPAWREVVGPVPSIELSARFVLDAAWRGAPRSRWLPLRALTALPDARVLDGRTTPLVLAAGVSSTTWRLTLPDGECPPAPIEERVENPAGSVTLRVSAPVPGQLLVLRETDLRESWIEPDGFADVRALCVAESRADRTRVTLNCADP